MSILLRALAALCVAAAMPAAVASTIGDGSFEKPVVPVGGTASYGAGQKFGPWKVVGAGQVAITSGSYTENGNTFPAATGAQWVDLTGDGSNQVTGIMQTVATTPGAVYTLSFKVSNLDKSGYGTDSTMKVSVDGAPLVVATNASNTNTSAQNWRLFKAEFIAATVSTTLTFYNGDPSDDNLNGLDAVSLVRNPN